MDNDYSYRGTVRDSEYFKNINQIPSNYELFRIVQDWLKTGYNPDENGFVDNSRIARWIIDKKCVRFGINLYGNERLLIGVTKICNMNKKCFRCKRYLPDGNFEEYENNAIEINKLKDQELDCDYFSYYLGYIRTVVDDCEYLYIYTATIREFEKNKNITSNEVQIRTFLSKLGYSQIYNDLYFTYNGLLFCIPFFLINLNKLKDAVRKDDVELFEKYNGYRYVSYIDKFDKIQSFFGDSITNNIINYDAVKIFKRIYWNVSKNKLKEGTKCYHWRYSL